MLDVMLDEIDFMLGNECNLTELTEDEKGIMFKKLFLKECKPVHLFNDERDEYTDFILAHNSGKFFWSFHSGRIYKPTIDKSTGRYIIGIRYWNEEIEERGGKRLNKTEYVSRLICNAFWCNFYNKKFVHHIDGNKLNDNYMNLIWVTKEEHELLDRCARDLKRLPDGDLKSKVTIRYSQFIESIRNENGGLI